MNLDLIILGALAVFIIWAARNDAAIQAFRRSK